MEVKDLLKDDLTEEEKVQLEIDTKKKKHKLLTKYLTSKKCKELIKKYVKKGDSLTKEIEGELEKRRKGARSKASVSDLDKTLAFYDFQVELANDLGESEAELILKEDLTKNAENTYTHCTNKIEELFDVPSYSELDLLKHKRIEYALIQDRIETMVGFYAETKNAMSNPNPYEEENPDFKALTDVS